MSLPHPRRSPLITSLLILASLASAACEGRQLRSQTRTLYDAKSEFNHIIVQEDADGIRTLRFGGPTGAIQSSMNTADPAALVLAYSRYAMCSLALVDQPRRILIVGLGGGSMPRFLREAIPSARIDAVELDPAVADVAKKFFHIQEDDKLKIHVGDGRKFIEQSRDQYDLIFLDAYGEDSVPYALATHEFYSAVNARLTDNGLCVSNLWAASANPLYYDMVKTHHGIFGELHIIRAEPSLNRIVLAFKGKPGLTRGEITRRSRLVPLMPDLWKKVDAGHEPLRIPADATILRDADAPKD